MHSDILCFTVLSKGPNPKSTPFPCGIRAPLWYMVPWEHLRPFTNATSLNSATTTVSDRHIHKHTDSTITGKVTITRQGIYFKIILISNSLTHTHTHPFNGPFSGTTQVGRYQKGKTNLDFTEARDSEWQWHQLGHMQVCTSLQTTTPAPHRSVFLQAGCPSCRPTNSVKALKA